MSEKAQKDINYAVEHFDKKALKRTSTSSSDDQSILHARVLFEVESPLRAPLKRQRTTEDGQETLLQHAKMMIEVEGPSMMPLKRRRSTDDAQDSLLQHAKINIWISAHDNPQKGLRKSVTIDKTNSALEDMRKNKVNVLI